MAKFEVTLQRPKWSESKAIKDHKAGLLPHQQGYDWSKPQVKKVSIDAKDQQQALSFAADAEEERLDEDVRVRTLKGEFEDHVAMEFFRRENRYIPMSAEYKGE